MSTNRDAPLLDRLDDDRAAVTASLRRRSYPPGRDIVTQGEIGTDFFVILQGTVAIIQGDEVRYLVPRGADCAWMRHWGRVSSARTGTRGV